MADEAKISKAPNLIWWISGAFAVVIIIVITVISYKFILKLIAKLI